jgi:DNA-binding NtrC family response regulator
VHAPPVRTLADAERDAIAAALAHTDGNRARAAELLGIARSTLAEKLKRYRLGEPTPDDSLPGAPLPRPGGGR